MVWKVVKFLNENSVEAVPQSWYIKSSSECFWPPQSCKREKVRRYIEQSAGPMTDWKVYPVVLLGSYEDFVTAEHKARKATVTSDLSSDNAMLGKGARKKRRNPKYESEDTLTDSSDDNSYPPVKKALFDELPNQWTSSRPIKLVRVRSRSYSPPKERDSVLQNQSTTYTDGNFQNISLSANKNTQSRSFHSTDDEFLTRNTESRNCNTDEIPNFRNQSLELKTLPQNSGTTMYNAGNILSDNSFKKAVLDEFSHLQLKINSLIDNIGTLININRRELQLNAASTDRDVEILNKKIPVKNEHDLLDLEAWLSNSELYKVMVLELRRVGGQSYAQATRKILYKILTNEVANLYSWDGAKQKAPFKTLRVAKAILESMKLQFSEASETDIISVIKTWLVKAKKRAKKSSAIQAD